MEKYSQSLNQSFFSFFCATKEINGDTKERDKRFKGQQTRAKFNFNFFFFFKSKSLKSIY